MTCLWWQEWGLEGPGSSSDQALARTHSWAGAQAKLGPGILMRPAGAMQGKGWKLVRLFNHNTFLRVWFWHSSLFALCLSFLLLVLSRVYFSNTLTLVWILCFHNPTCAWGSGPAWRARCNGARPSLFVAKRTCKELMISTADHACHQIATNPSCRFEQGTQDIGMAHSAGWQTGVSTTNFAKILLLYRLLRTRYIYIHGSCHPFHCHLPLVIHKENVLHVIVSNPLASPYWPSP
jgi:hypothetical protein